MMEKKCKKIYIQGMTCISCETIIKDELSGFEGVEEVVVCHKKKTAEIFHGEQEPSVEGILQKIGELGYKSSLNPDENNGFKKEKASAKQWLYSALIVVGLYLLYRLFSNLGFLSWLNVDPRSVSYGVAFLIGIVASLSTCLAIVGAVVISFAAKYKSRGTFYQANVKPHLLFHVGRLATFFVLGGFLGILGGWFDFSGRFMAWFAVLIAIVLAWLGLNILGIVPSISRFGVRMPKKMTHTWNKLKESEHALAPIILGGFTFFLPCGFTQSMQLFAVSSGSFWIGGMTMFLFALGTVPVLMGLGIATTKFSSKKAIVFKKAIGLIVILFAFYTLSTGLALAGINIDLGSNRDVGSTYVDQNEQVINMDINYQGFSPNVFKIKKGVPVKWVIDGQQITGCSNEIIIPELGISQKIFPGENVIKFTANKVGNLSFSCWMGMIRGKFIVEDGVGVVNTNAAAAYQDGSLNTSCGGGTSCGAVKTGGCGGGCGQPSCSSN